MGTDGALAWPVFDVDVERTAALETLAVEDLGDGLPLEIPTAPRLAAMLGDEPAPDAVRGLLPPIMGELRPDAVGYQCVMAGCAPGALPVVLAALEATLAEEFNLLGLLTTTGTPAVALLVRGLVTRRLGMNASTNCLGPGNPVNATLGRALALCLRNIAGAREGVGDMATMGQPGKYTFCAAEHEDGVLDSPGPMHNGADDAVTVLGISGTLEVLPASTDRGPEAVLEPAALAMAAAQVVASGTRVRDGLEQCLLLPPELAQVLAHAGWQRADAQAFLLEAGNWNLARLEPRAHEPAIAAGPTHIRIVETGGAGVKMTCLVPWAGGTRAQTRRL